MPKKHKNICTGPPPPQELHITIFFFLFRFMLRGTWIWRKTKISWTRVHGFAEEIKFHVPGYMNLKKKILLCAAQGVGVARRNFFFFGNFFQHVKKLFNFWNFVNIKVAKSKLNHLGFYCKLYFFDRTIRKIRNWNWNWVLIDGTPYNLAQLCSRIGEFMDYGWSEKGTPLASWFQRGSLCMLSYKTRMRPLKR